MAENQKPNAITEVFPYLRVRNAPAAIEFYRQVFAAELGFELKEPGGRIGHAELKIGPAMVMISEEHPEHGIYSPLEFGGTGSLLHLHVENVDEMTDRAVRHGAKVTMPPRDQFYGERSSKIVDPFGHEWMLGQHIEAMSPDEMQKRYTDLLSSKS